MTTPETIPRPRRVIIALDPEAQCSSALEAAARIAAQRGAELVGLFVEDSALIDAAALPMTRNIRRSGAAEEAVDARRMEQGLRFWAARAEAMLRWKTQLQPTRADQVKGELFDGVLPWGSSTTDPREPWEEE